MHDAQWIEASEHVAREVAPVEPRSQTDVQLGETFDLLVAQLTFRRDEEVHVALLRIEALERKRAVQVDPDELVAQQLREASHEVVEQAV